MVYAFPGRGRWSPVLLGCMVVSGAVAGASPAALAATAGKHSEPRLPPPFMAAPRLNRVGRPRQEARRRIDTKFAYYPSYNVMQARVNLKGLAGWQKVRAVGLQVVDQQTQRVIAAATVAPHRGVAWLHRWKLPPLKGALIRVANNKGGLLYRWKKLPLDGKYELVVRLAGVRARPRTYSFVRYHFPWEHNQLGRANLVVPPFKPLQVHGKKVAVVLRQYTMNGIGLWRQVKALGRNLLTGPMRLVVRAGGKRFPGHGRLKFSQRAPTRVAAVARWSAGPLRGTSHSVWDYDGMMKTSLTLEPTRERLGSVTLVIPLVNKRVPLMTESADTAWYNYAGRTPAGLGEVWNGGTTARGHVIGSYEPYIWVGGPERGVAVFGDNDRGWVDYRAKTPCQEMVRKANGTLELRLNLVAKPTRIRKARKIVLGFQATPIKPMPPHWRLWTSHGPHPMMARHWRLWATDRFLRRRLGGYSQVYLSSCFYWGSLTPSRDFYPRGGDFSIYRQLARARRTGKIDRWFIRKWVSGYPEHPLEARWTGQYRWSIPRSFRAMAAKPHGVLVYTNARGIRFDTPEGQTYLDEWDRHAFPKRRWPYGGGGDVALDPVRSFRDFAVWYYQKMLSTFADAIYFDDIFFQPNFKANTVGTEAYKYPDGSVQPSMGLWNMRALIRRAAVLAQEMGKPNANMVHMTNSAIAPILAFARQDVDCEMRAGENAYQDRFSRAFLQTEAIGRQFGNVPYVLAENYGPDPRKVAWAIRTQAGVMLTFELKLLWGNWNRHYSACYWKNYDRLVKFGYGTPRVKVWNYWRHGYPLEITGDKTSSIILSKPGQALIVVCDWGHGGLIHLRLDHKVLLLPGRLTATDLETHRPLAVTAGGRIVFHLRKHDFKILLAK